MKIVKCDGRLYFRRWFKWYFVTDMIAFEVNFKRKMKEKDDDA